jgi:phosphoribosylcarboxyaminoimidazole (NCAIR) mutase
MAVDGAENAAIFAAEILSLSEPALKGVLALRRRAMREAIERADAGLSA